jgi:hypothetical protein
VQLASISKSEVRCCSAEEETSLQDLKEWSLCAKYVNDTTWADGSLEQFAAGARLLVFE